MKSRENELHFVSVLSDLFILNLCTFFFAYITQIFQFEEKSDIYICIILLNLSWLLAYIFVQRRVLHFHKGFQTRLLRILKRSLIFSVLCVLFALPVAKQIGHLWPFLLSTCLLFTGLKIGVNFIYFQSIKHQYKHNIKTRKVLFVKKNKTMQQIRKVIEANPLLKYKFSGYIDDENNDEDVIGPCNKFTDIIREHEIQAVFISVDSAGEFGLACDNEEDLLRICNQMGVRLYYVPVNERIETGNYNEKLLDGLILVNPQKFPLDMAENQIKKRAFDLLFSAFVVICILSWFYPLMALLIKTGSKGPVLFTQKRTGLNQKTFDCYKFRSMCINKECDELQASKNDMRITRIGKFLRKSNIDELPQFFNVLKGDMSVVGPRPHMLRHTEKYSALIDDYLVRHYVKPGITGWAQVNGFRGETDELWKMEKRVECDKEYIRNWSFERDFVIIWKTIFDLKAFINAR